MKRKRGRAKACLTEQLVFDVARVEARLIIDELFWDLDWARAFDAEVRLMEILTAGGKKLLALYRTDVLGGEPPQN